MRAPIDVLVVDDDAAVRRRLGSILARHQYRVVEAASGADALALRQPSSVDVVLVDVVLPDHSGLDVTAWNTARRQRMSRGSSAGRRS